jgi:hypothetical protein
MTKTSNKASSTQPKAAASKAASPATRAAPRRKAPRPPTTRPWSEVANFVLTFETRLLRSGREERRITAHKMQDGGITARWTGHAQQPMVNWIAEHLGDWGELPSQESVPPDAESAHVTHPPSPPSAATASTAVSPKPWLDAAQVSLSITAVVARQAGAMGSPAGAPATLQPSRARLRGGEVFDLDATIEVSCASPLPAAPLASQCKVEFFGRNLSTKKSIRIGEASIDADLVSGAGVYQAHLGGLSLPPGTYRLNSIASLPTRTARLAHTEGPLLDVI